MPFLFILFQLFSFEEESDCLKYLCQLGFLSLSLDADGRVACVPRG